MGNLLMHSVSQKEVCTREKVSLKFCIIVFCEIGRYNMAHKSLGIFAAKLFDCAAAK